MTSTPSRWLADTVLLTHDIVGRWASLDVGEVNGDRIRVMGGRRGALALPRAEPRAAAHLILGATDMLGFPRVMRRQR